MVTLAEEILARASGMEEVKPCDIETFIEAGALVFSIPDAVRAWARMRAYLQRERSQ